jgi:hypothetical protein
MKQLVLLELLHQLLELLLRSLQQSLHDAQKGGQLLQLGR